MKKLIQPKWRIDWADRKQREVVALAKIGIATKVIAESTGLSVGQVRKRMKDANVKLGDWRNGKSHLSKWAAACMMAASKMRYEQTTPRKIGPSTLANDRLLVIAWPSKR
jgi:DNA-binding CsgD family transcriptional regulator